MGQQKKTRRFWPNWAFPDCNCSLKSLMATKWCSKLDVAQKGCSIVFQGHPLNHTEQKIADFYLNWTIPDCNSKLLTSGFEMMYKAWLRIKEVYNCFSRSSIKFKDHMGPKIDDLNPIWVSLLSWSQLSNSSDFPCFKSNRLPQFSSNLSNIWLQCAQQYCLKTCGIKILNFCF